MKPQSLSILVPGGCPNNCFNGTWEYRNKTTRISNRVET